MKSVPETPPITAGGALLARLKALGVDYVFANSGTDFPPIVEALAQAAATGTAVPRALVIPHEHAAMGMAHGYFLASGRPQAVMAHTNVGLANCAIGAINAATERVPVLLFSGRTPVTEAGRLGSRTVPIGWGQEMRDQAALVREAVKWDYELRVPEQAGEIVDRAHAIAQSTPKGPVYLSLPREVLCEPCPADRLDAPPVMRPVTVAPPAAAIAEAARLLAAAERPVIVAQRGAGSAEGFDALARLAQDWGIPVVQYWAIQLAVATDHPMAVGTDPAPWLATADVVLAIDCLAPWSPDIHRLPPHCRVIQAGPDPLWARFPVRDFPCDLALAGETADLLVALEAAMRPLRAGARERCEVRQRAVAERAAAIRRAVQAEAEAGCAAPMTKAWVSLCLSRALEGRDAAVLSELGAPLEPLTLRRHGSWHQEPHSGGLGWSFPAALGMQLAGPDRLIVATMGDGSYMFSNPVACHQIAEALALPVLVMVLNNGEWGAVRRSVLDVYPDGHAARSNAMPLVSLAPSPDFTRVAEASRARAWRVEAGPELAAVLAAAIDHVTTTRTHALVEIRIRP
ncbi:thiamine pyrophosphate-requiring protein [Rhodoplanes sp. TEM]|uniref:Thiamine pyrophosphate-requiring protein n=1 Tax=Rhodoplanes tepidamans TaxID=200616 RepID=A0ABT5JBI8_RHOTP|nr:MULTISPECIES: thiamine pyrophosphate-requiring protein [Rhodoplanes]MDC7786741.1 thiamine pyrophosphate-requiring protein [Rhodoplanes tepidamans]MDC7983747.1 thiamine pyrophosphate-requiring protein [Rhodoplanes sp. TEM]MDQ0358178.1 acetolactate synthase-1/2/3 large subunit [Rhodoplanes tepidamans]